MNATVTELKGADRLRVLADIHSGRDKPEPHQVAAPVNRAHYGEIRVAVDDALINALIDATAALPGAPRVDLEGLLLQCRCLRRAVQRS